MKYRIVGQSGLKLPEISLGLWHSFGADDNYENSKALLRTAYDAGITHFDLGNNYGPPPGAAETTLGRLLKADFYSHRDQLIISTKAGYDMWEGPYGSGSSRKHLIASLDQSLSRLGLDYVDVFYSHRYDPETPIEETMGALDAIVRQGKALYVGISSYPAVETRKACKILRDLGTPCLIHQPRYSILAPHIEGEGVLSAIEEESLGCIVFSPLAQGLLTNKYLNGIPAGSRADKGVFLRADDLTPERLDAINALNDIAKRRGQTLAQMALSWVLRPACVTSALIGASRPEQIIDCVKASGVTAFEDHDLDGIARVAKQVVLA